MDSAGEDVQLLMDSARNESQESTEHDDHSLEDSGGEPAETGKHCHSHAGVE